MSLHKTGEAKYENKLIIIMGPIGAYSYIEISEGSYLPNIS